MASKWGSAEIVNLLLEFGANVKAVAKVRGRNLI